MANKKTKQWSKLSISKQAALEKEWNRINRARTKAGQKSYGSRGKSAWLKAKGIKSNGNGIVRGTQRMKRLKRKYGE
jgi:hypothetical protein